MKRRKCFRWLAGVLCGILLFTSVGTDSVVYAENLHIGREAAEASGAAAEENAELNADGNEAADPTTSEEKENTGDSDTGAADTGTADVEDGTGDDAEIVDPGDSDEKKQNGGVDEEKPEENPEEEKPEEDSDLEEPEMEDIPEEEQIFEDGVFWYAADAESRAADDLLTVKYKPTFKQTMARDVLPLVNKLRTTKSMAWYWDSDNKTKIQCDDLTELKWDGGLEQIAMQRAAEMAVEYSHTRPNGGDCWSAYGELRSYAAGENIAAGYTSSQAVYTGWEEKNELYSGQGHRRNMLAKNSTAIGIGCVYYNGTYYWAMELGRQKNENISEGGAAFNGAREMQVDVSESRITKFSCTAPAAKTISYGESFAAPSVSGSIATAKTWVQYGGKNPVPGLTITPQWKVEDANVAEIADGEISGTNPGKTNVKATIAGKTIQFALTVSAVQLTEEHVTLEKDSFEATGGPIEPEPVVTCEGKELVEGTDYELTYENNTKIGTATVTVNGIGGYTGTVVKEFIIHCDHEYEDNVCKKCGHKLPQASDVTFRAPENLTYSATEKQAAVTAKENGMGKITLHYYDKGGALLKKAPVNAGTYTVKVSVGEGTEYGATREDLEDDSWKFTITKAPLTITADDLVVKKDVKNLPYAYTAEGFLGNDEAEIKTKIEVTYTDTAQKDEDGNYQTGIYEITPSVTEEIRAKIENYEITCQSGSLMIGNNVETKETDETIPASQSRLKFGTLYSYTPNKAGKSIAFTSRFAEGTVQPEYRKASGRDTWHEWNLDTATGNYFMEMEKDTEYLLRVTKKERTGAEGVMISLPGYDNPAVSTTFKLASLTEEQLAGTGSASRMSAAYKISGTSIAANGTLKYISNASGYLGGGNTYKDGYFLAFRINVQQERFKEDGYISVSYTDGTGEKQQQFYEFNDENCTLKDGYVDVILDVTDSLPETQIRVALDAMTNIKTYTLKPGDVKKEAVGNSRLGIVSEPTEEESFGVRTSSPVLKEGSENGDVEAVYDAVAYSVKTQIPGEASAKGNYLALKFTIPESMRNQYVSCRYEMENGQSEDTPVAYCGIPQGKEYALLVINAGTGNAAAFDKEIRILWDTTKDGTTKAEGAKTLTRSVTLKKTENCVYENIPDNALLPKTLAFNGLATTMYVGQTQDIASTIGRKYEEDKIRLSYSTGDNSILSVNRVTGVVRALNAGTTTVTVEAIDAEGNSITKSSKITVKNPTAPASLKASAIKDTEVTISWSKNVTGQRLEVYAVPYDEAYDANTRKTAAKWKEYIEAECKKEGEKAAWANPCKTVGSSEPTAVITGLQEDTPYLFYVRNVADSAAGTSVYAGSVSAKITTKKTVFASIKLIPQIETVDEAGKNPVVTDVTGNDFMIGNDGSPGKENVPNKFSYQLLDKEGTKLTDQTLITSVAYKSSNTGVMKIDKNGKLTPGGQAGVAKLYVTGKDTSGTVRTSDEVTIRVTKAPAALKAKTTTLLIGQSTALKDLIQYDGVKGAVSEFEMAGIDFEAALEKLPKEYFVWDTSEDVTGDTMITAAALIPNKNGVPASGGTVKADFTLTKTGADGGETTSTATATIKINDMAAPAIKSVTPADTSVNFTFTPNSTVRQLKGENYYYTVTVRDMVTGAEAELRQKENAASTVIHSAGAINNLSMTLTEAADMTAKSPVCSAEITGLSSNKKYRISVTAHYDITGSDNREMKNQKMSGTKDFTTKNRLLASDGSMGVTYISLSDLKKTPNADGAAVFDETKKDSADYGHIALENNETYILMAQVSNLARALETDKIKWTISSGDTKAASIKACSSTFEAKLSAVRTGTFTVTAASTVTKKVLATFTVTIIPYQSSSADGTQTASAGEDIPYLGEILGDPFGEEKKRTA